MKARKAKAWVKALRSGKYKQGRNDLYNPEDKSFCCLGVLAHVSKVSLKHITGHGLLDDYMRDKCELKTDNGETLDEKPIWIKGNRYESLATANDAGISFKRIANWIEKNYKKL